MIFWSIKSFSEWTKEEMYEVLQLRAEVFIVEQNCPYQDIDGKDMSSLHVMGRNEKGWLVAYSRLVEPGVSYAECSIGRVITKTVVRNTGVGRELMEVSIDHALRVFSTNAIRISAQKYLETFYASLGFVHQGKEYLEDNIPHVEMLLLK